MPRYRVNYGFERSTDDPDDVLRFGQGFLYVETEKAIENNSPEMMEVLRTIGMNNGYIKVGLQAIVQVDDDDELEVVSDNNDRL